MPDWNSDESVERQTTGIVYLAHIIAGIYFWEVVVSLDFEWSYISGKRQFRWPIIAYFLTRYLALAAMVGSIIGFDMKSGLNCRAFFIFLQMTGNASTGMSTINLALRTIAIWEKNRYVIGTIILLVLGHWSLILQGGLLQASQVPGVGCVIVHTNIAVLTANFVVSMVFDLVIVILTAYRLMHLRGRHQNGLVSVVFRDGLIYFICAFLANLVATIFMIMDLSPVMSIIFNVPSVVICAIASTRAVRSLATFAADGPHIYYSGTILPTDGRVDFRSHVLPTTCPNRLLSIGRPREGETQEGFCVQMETEVAIDAGAERTSQSRHSRRKSGSEEMSTLGWKENLEAHSCLKLSDSSL